MTNAGRMCSSKSPRALSAARLLPAPPGVIEIKRGERTVFALATATPEQESDLAALPASVFQNRLAGGRAVAFRGLANTEEAEDTVWAWLALGCAVSLATELFLLRALST